MNPESYKFEWHHCIKCGVYQSAFMLTEDKRFCKLKDCQEEWERKQKTESTFRGPGR